jgi:hypothetical protein
LNFDDKQIAEYDVIIKTHQLQIRTAEKDILRLKKELYELLKNDQNGTKDSLVNELAKIQTNIENAHFSHFQAIKKICTPNQINDYNTLILDFGKIFGGKPKPNEKK